MRTQLLKQLKKKLQQLKKRIGNAKRGWLKSKHPFFRIEADIKHVRNGKIIWKQKGIEIAWNGLHNGGESLILGVFFRGATAPTSFYLGLGNNGGTPGEPADNATLSSITEVSGTGYSRQTIERSTTGFPTLQLDSTSGDWEVISKEITFQNTGSNNWTAADYLFLTDVSSGTSGTLIASAALSLSRTLAPNDSLICSIQIRLA